MAGKIRFLSRLVFVCPLLLLVGVLSARYFLRQRIPLRQTQSTRAEWLEQFLGERAARMRVPEVDCAAVLRGDPDQLELANAKEREREADRLPTETDEYVRSAASSCHAFLKQYAFITNPLSDLERNFPLAYSIVIYKDSAQVVDLLRTIYRPQNSYCIHVDKKASAGVRDAMLVVSRCLPGVFLASRSVDVVWGTYWVLEPDMVCMRDLWKKGKGWAYFINLTGQEFPLKTNYELVKILQALKGSNDVDVGNPGKLTKRRWKHTLPAPFNLTVYKGSVHVTLSRGFVDFILHDHRAQAFLKWCRNTHHASEHFFNTLNYNPQLKVPGSFNASKDGVPLVKSFFSRYKIWKGEHDEVCDGGKFVRSICILSVKQLPDMHRSKYLFANKFHSGYSRLALSCLAEELSNRTRDEALGMKDIDVTFYENRPFSTMHRHL